MNWKLALNGFRAYLMLERSLSPNSLDAYMRDVAKLQQFLTLKNLNYLPTEVPPKVISDLMTYLMDIRQIR